MQIMESLSRRQATEIRKLSQRKHRDETGQFIAEGLRAVEQILNNRHVSVDIIVVSDASIAASLPKFAKIFLADVALLNELSDTENPQGILALCRQVPPKPISYFLQQTGNIMVCDRIQDPGNLGTIYRSASWFGAKGIILGTGTTDLFHPKVIRSTAGSTGTLPWMTGELKPLLSELQNHGWEIFLLDDGTRSIPISQVENFGRKVFVVGNEANGISSEHHSAGFKSLSIPGKSEFIESLNASVAASIVLFHFSK